MNIIDQMKNILSAIIYIVKFALLIVAIMAPLCIIYGFVSEQLEPYGFNYGVMLYGSGGIAFLVFVSLYVCRTKYRSQLRIVMKWKNCGMQIALSLVVGVLCKAVIYAVSCRMYPGMIINVWSDYDSLKEFLSVQLQVEPIATFWFAVIIGPITEELICRFHLGQHFEQDFSRPFTAILSASLFAMLHFDTTALGFITHLLTGLFLYLLYCKTGSLLCAIAAHMGMNIYVDVLRNFDISSFVTGTLYTIIASCLMIVIVAWMLCCPDRLPYHINSSQSFADSFTIKE